MHFTEYINTVRTCDRSYLAIALIGETGEFADEWKKCLREGGNITDKRHTNLKLELGDILWYVVSAIKSMKCEDRDFKITLLDTRDISGLTVDLAKWAAYMAETLQAGGLVWSADFMFVLNRINTLASCLGCELEEIMDLNVKKLSERQNVG